MGYLSTKKIVPTLLGIAFIFISIRYNIILDMCILFLLFTSAYSIGMFIPTVGHPIAKCFANTALGLGVIGVIIYYFLLFGVGSKSLYIILLLTPIALAVVCHKVQNSEMWDYIRDYIIPKNLALIEIIICIFMFYIICGSAPISAYDSLTKHLPITIYAGTSGKWYANIIESIVYGESMLMQYTYSAMLYSLGAYKAITLFNVVLFFLIFIMLIYFCKSLYKRTSIALLTVIYFTTPMFFEYSRIFYLEMLCIYFLFAAVMPFTTLKPEYSWKNLPIIAWLFGCSLFTKLTTSYCILIVGILVIVLSCIYYKRERTKFNLISYFIISGVIFIFPFLTSVLVTYYRNGNPLLPMFNGFFKSPYFGKYNFVDPFNSSPLGLNIQSLINIVFRTSKNVEMANGGLGGYLLLMCVIPIGIIIHKKKDLFIWSLVPFIMFGISCIFTYNLRYSLAIFMILGAIIVVNISICFDRVTDNLKIQHMFFSIIIVFLMIPNLFYIGRNHNIKEMLTVNESLAGNQNREILSEIPQGKSVFSVNDPFKGDFKGFYNAYMWHNSVILQMFQEGSLSITDYLKAFDYVLYKNDESIKNDELSLLIEKAGTSESFLIPYIEKKNYSLFKVHSQENYTTIKDQKLNPYIKISLDNPIFYRFDQDNTTFQIQEILTNDSLESIEGRFQINWYGEDNSLIDVDLKLFNIVPGTKTYTSKDIERPANATYGVWLINTNSTQEVLVNSYTLNAKDEQINYIEDLTQKYYNRYFIKSENQ